MAESLDYGNGESRAMIIWIDGVYGVGKTTVVTEIKERISDNEVEFLESDTYRVKSLKRRVKEAIARNGFPSIGTLPQNDIVFLREFKDLIDEKSKETTKKLIIDMALIMQECKEELLDKLKNEGKKIVHIVLTADEETIRTRIKNDENRMKEVALDWLKYSISFLEKNYQDAIWLNTDNLDVPTIANEIIEIIK